MVTRENYEIYFMDYFDGNLSVEMTAKLLLFLEQNQDLKEEFESFENINISELENDLVSTNSIDFTDFKKSTLINKENEEDYIIGYIENDLSEEEKQSLSLYISDKEESKQKLESYKKTKLIAPTLVFPNKNKLKKSNVKSIYFYASLFSAACILAFILIPYFNTISPTEVIHNPTFAEKNTPEINLPKDEKEILPIENKNSEKKQLLALNKKSKTTLNPKTIIPEIRTKIYIEKHDLKQLDITKKVETLRLPTFEPIQTPEINQNKPKVQSYSLLGFAKNRTNSFLKKETGFDMNNPKGFLKNTSLKTQKFVKERGNLTEKEDENYTYKSFKIGRLLEIKWKTKK